MKRRASLLAAAAPIVAAALFYLTLRARTVWFVGEMLRSPLGPSLAGLREVTVPLGAHLPSFVMDAAPDFLWALALGALLSTLHPRGRARTVFGVVGFAGVIGYEVAQRLHVVPGTFDWTDLVAQAAGFAIGWLSARVEGRAHVPSRAERRADGAFLALRSFVSRHTR